jgi:hypothetical protein
VIFVNELIINYLKSLKTKRVSLTNLENLVSGQITYTDFASEIIALEESGFLSRISNRRWPGRHREDEEGHPKVAPSKTIAPYGDER